MTIFSEKNWKLRIILLVLLIVISGFLGYVRLAPSDPEEWHKQAYPSGMGDISSSAGFIWRAPIADDDKDRLSRLDQIIMSTPRTTRLAGSVEAGKITYVTRSAVIGFPDYTTVGVYQGLIEDGDIRYLEINGRLRFGQSDFGVNAKRIKGWLAQL
ncbi:MAG: DUF1499 domain-containing protein [Sulfitobacter sp.]